MDFGCFWAGLNWFFEKISYPDSYTLYYYPCLILLIILQTHELQAANKVLTDQVSSLTKRIDELETNNVNLQNELTKFTG